jgi:Protein tyrosine and serine/threonine kinase
MYMAPEMVSSHHYSEKVDVFAMAVMLYEALKCRLNVSRIAMGGGEPGALQEYADNVSQGFREEIPSNWPPAIIKLIKDAWHQVLSQLCHDRWIAPPYYAIHSNLVL